MLGVKAIHVNEIINLLQLALASQVQFFLKAVHVNKINNLLQLALVSQVLRERERLVVAWRRMCC